MSWYCLENKEVKARKLHRCYLCNFPIYKGELHISRSGIDGEGYVRIHMHTLCESHTKNWDEDCWLSHEPYEFREYLLAKKEL